MNDTANGLEAGGEDCLVFEVSDAALEVAAGNPLGAAMSFPNAPTVSVLVVCCSNDDAAISVPAIAGRNERVIRPVGGRLEAGIGSEQ